MTGHLVREQGFWTCEHCTLRNDNILAESCEVCNLPRYTAEDA